LTTAASAPPAWTVVRPEWWALALSAAAWLAVLALHAAPAGIPLCLAGAVGGDPAGRLRAAWLSGALGRALLDWALMTLAMMTPLTLPLLRHVVARSFASRRHRAAALFLAGALAPWLLLGLAGLPLLAAAPAWATGAPWLAACGLLFAAAWQLSPMKRAALRRCHLTLPLAAHGARADMDCVRQGLAHARGCILSCWALMGAMTLAPYHPLVAVCMQGVVLAERRSCRPPLVQTAVALTLGAAAVSAAVLL
jgi:predicted metal-binding membrane protein